MRVRNVMEVGQLIGRVYAAGWPVFASLGCQCLTRMVASVYVAGWPARTTITTIITTVLREGSTSELSGHERSLVLLIPFFGARPL